MAHGGAKIIVPVGSMQTIALVEIHGVGHIGQMISGARHGRGFEFDPYLELTRDCRRPRCTC